MFGRTRVWLLGALGVGSMVYVFGARILGSGEQDLPTVLVWPLLAVVPLLGLGLWLASVSDGSQGVYVLLGGTGMAVGSVYETVIWPNPELVSSPRFSLLNG